MTDYIRSQSRVALKKFPKIQGWVRRIDYGIKDEVRSFESSVAHVYWDDGKHSHCPIDQLDMLKTFIPDRYPWEKPEDKEKPSPDDVKKQSEDKEEAKPKKVPGVSLREAFERAQKRQ